MAINNITLPNVDASTNRISSSGYVYDENGNLINDPQGRQFTFNGDNKQTLVKDANNQVIGQYLYDGSGKRIKKITSTETTIFVYSGSKLIAEYSTQQSSTPTISYTATDMLGSPRVITDANGQVISRRDFMAFGEEIASNVGGRTTANKYGQSDSVRQRFTGYHKDEETGLDFAEARYYNGNHGRFTAVDPLLASGKSTNPQTFNRYVYSMNRPLIMTDPTGMQAGFVARHPKIASEIGYAETNSMRTNVSSVAARFAVNSAFENQREGGEQNALRHVIWSAMITAKYGPEIAKDATDSHEDTSKINIPKNGRYEKEQDADTAADLSNNAIGIELGNRAIKENLTPGQIANEALTIFKEKGLFVTRIQDGGSATLLITKIGQKEVDITKKNWANRNEQTGFTPEKQKAFEQKLKDDKAAAEQENRQRRSERPNEEEE